MAACCTFDRNSSAFGPDIAATVIWHIVHNDLVTRFLPDWLYSSKRCRDYIKTNSSSVCVIWRLGPTYSVLAALRWPWLILKIILALKSFPLWTRSPLTLKGILNISQSLHLSYCRRVLSHLDYCSSLWAPYMKGDIEVIERIQKEKSYWRGLFTRPLFSVSCCTLLRRGGDSPAQPTNNVWRHQYDELYVPACTRPTILHFPTGRRHGRQLVCKHSAQSASRLVQTFTW